MKKQNHHPSYVACVAEILRTSQKPLSVDSLVSHIESKRPVGKGVRSAIYQAIGKLYQAIPVAPGCYGWLSSLLHNHWFRHPLNGAEIRKGFLLLDELEHAVFFPEFFQSHQPDNRIVRLNLMGGPILEAEARIEQGTWSLHMGAAFSEWIDLMGGSPHDDLLIGVVDASAGEYSVRLQPREARQKDEILLRNRLLVEAAEEIVASDRKARAAVPVWELAAALIGRGIYDNPVPPDDMHYVLHEQSGLVLVEDNGYALRPQSTAYNRDWAQQDAGKRSLRSQRTADDLPPWRAGESPETQWEDSFFQEFFSEELHHADAADLEEAVWSFFADEYGSDGDDEDAASEHCEGYQAYLAELMNGDSDEEPLSHTDFHLLEAELEMLVGLEQEFGYLRPEQDERKLRLAEILFIDLNFFFDDSDWDQADFDDPPFWEN